ncbi:Alpha/beta hydrolase fold protein [Hyphomicrobiales bacterium]|nr:Alpha/beta hydrolase fold protein [Hyphomicrobiales bacterium]CAH1671547.1 Alpha/beta hydrolase fold protein [Hyphomicrobiales bacterium]
MPLVRTADGCRLHVEVEGEGEPVVLISGINGRADFWNRVRAPLSERYRLVTFDQRGIGRSERAAEPFTIELMAADVLAILDDLGLERAHVIGHSTGGAIAQTLAIDAPSRIDRLVLSGTWARADFRFQLLFGTRLSVLERAGQGPYAALGQLLAYPPDWINANELAIFAKLAEADRDEHEPVDVVAERIRMLLAFDRLSALKEISARTLVLSARDDLIVPFTHAQTLAREIAGSRLAETQGGHFFPALDAPAFARTVREFLEEA